MNAGAKFLILWLAAASCCENEAAAKDSPTASPLVIVEGSGAFSIVQPSSATLPVGGQRTKVGVPLGSNLNIDRALLDGPSVLAATEVFHAPIVVQTARSR